MIGSVFENAVTVPHYRRMIEQFIKRSIMKDFTIIFSIFLSLFIHSFIRICLFKFPYLFSILSYVVVSLLFSNIRCFLVTKSLKTKSSQFDTKRENLIRLCGWLHKFYVGSCKPHILNSKPIMKI